MVVCWMNIRLILAAALLAAPLRAQMPRDFEVIKGAEGVYTFVQKEPLASPVDGDTTVIVNDADVVVVDTRITPASAREVIREIKRLTPPPVRFVVNTHFHSDHHYGNDAFRRAYPGVEFIAHPMTLKDLLEQDNDSILRRNVDSTYPAAIALRRKVLADGKTVDGNALTPALREFYEKQIPALEYATAELRTVTLVRPTLVAEDFTLHRGKRTIRVRFMGRANTRGDLVVHLPEERIVITGDVLVWLSPSPSARSWATGRRRSTASPTFPPTSSSRDTDRRSATAPICGACRDWCRTPWRRPSERWPRTRTSRRRDAPSPSIRCDASSRETTP